MKVLLYFIFLLFFSLSSVNAESDFENDYSLIDCVEGNDSSGVAFDSSMPYQTLKGGIEKTIAHINANINKSGNEETASGKTFSIKVNCSFNDILNTSINLNFDGVTFNNEIIIEGIMESSLIFKEIDFKLSHKTGNITFKNAKFLNENKPYFYDYIFPSDIQKRQPYSNGIKIIDSYIQLKNGYNIGEYIKYKLYDYKYYNSWSGKTYYYYKYPYNYVNKQIITNSIIDIDVDNNFSFRMPMFLKDSKVNFNNTGTGTNNITFLEAGNIKSSSNLNYSIFVSNELNIGGNNLIIEDTQNITFINNKLYNFLDLNLGLKGIFINNFIDNNQKMDITDNQNLYNNIFKSGFSDSYDTMNYKRNFSIDDSGKSGLGWVYKRLRDNRYLNIDINNADLYKQVTGKELLGGLGDIYIIFNY